MPPRNLDQAVARISRALRKFRNENGELSDEDVLDILFRLTARQKRNGIRRSPYGGGPGSKAARAADRFARSKGRELLKQLRKSGMADSKVRLSKKHLLIRFVHSPILDRLLDNRAGRWRPPLRRRAVSEGKEIRLTNFSFLTHPQETLAAIKSIAEIEISEREAHLHFEDPYCLDAGAYLVLAEIWYAVRHVLVGGKMARPVQKVLAATGVGEHNRMKLLSIGQDHEDDLADVWAFTLQRRRPAGSSQSATLHLDPQSREKVVDQLCDKIDEWLDVSETNRELTQEGRGWIGLIIGELLCNAERHSQAGSDDGDWATTAFMVRRDDGDETRMQCYLAFLSVGRSIAESLADAAPDIRSALESYVSSHRRCGLSPDTLATVFALQDTVTRDPNARGNNSGGTGLQDVMELVEELGGTTAGSGPMITVVSGSSCIQLRRPYMQGTRKSGPHSPRLIWFNGDNSKDVAPDPTFVKDLKDHFSGTLVSIAFTLDPAYLAAQTESENENH